MSGSGGDVVLPFASGRFFLGEYVVDFVHYPLRECYRVVDGDRLGGARPGILESGKLPGREEARRNEGHPFSSFVHGGIIRLRFLFA